MNKSHAVGWASDAPTPAQLKEFFAQIEAGRIKKDRLQGFLRGVPDVSAILTDWQVFYKNFLGIDVDFSSVQIPERQPGFDRLIVVVQGLTPNRVYEACLKQFPCWRYTEDLDESVPSNDRKPNQTYAIWVRDRQEADEELKNLSASYLREQGIPGITLLERLLYELKYWSETHQHLDIQSLTLCAGSRGSNGGVPDVHSGSDGLVVGWYCFDSWGCTLRSRSAVSCQL